MLLIPDPDHPLAQIIGAHRSLSLRIYIYCTLYKNAVDRHVTWMNIVNKWIGQTHNRDEHWPGQILYRDEYWIGQILYREEYWMEG